MENSKLPAYPVKIYRELADDVKNNFGAFGGYNPTGLTKREYFAAMAIQGLLSNPNVIINLKQHEIMLGAVSYADALLKELEK